MNRTRILACFAGVLAAMALSACGGSNTVDTTVGGTVSGLAAGTSVTLLDNGGNPYTASSNGSFVFSQTVASQTPYSVTVQTQPAGQTCLVSNGAGNIDFAGDAVTSVGITCLANVAVPVSVSGLSGGTLTLRLTLENQAGAATTINVTADGNYTFPTLLSIGQTYAVDIKTQPVVAPPIVCSVASGASGGVVSVTTSGTVAITPLPPAVITCSKT